MRANETNRLRHRVLALIDWKRLLIALPVLAVGAIGLLIFAERTGPPSSTPRAFLMDTAAADGVKIGPQRNQVARNFTGTAPDGSLVTLSDLRGSPTIINFWATWCTSCLAELPDFKALQQELGDENLNVVAVNTGEGSSTAQRFLDELNADTFHVVMDPTLVVSDAYGVFGMPTSIFLDADGVVRATYVGHLNPELMREYVAAAQTATDAGEPPPELRLITTVARERTLEVLPVEPGAVEFRSRSLRCDESYCAEDAIDAFASEAGVRVLDRMLDRDPPTIVVSYAGEPATASRLAQTLAAILEAHDDPLYERAIDIVER